MRTPLQTTRTPSYDRLFRLVTLAALSMSFCSGARAQAQSGTQAADVLLSSGPSASFSAGLSNSNSDTADASLPDAPSAQQASSQGQPVAGPGHKVPHRATATDPIISPGQIAPNQTVRDKFILSIKNSISPIALAGDTISAGYSHLTNGSPKLRYGWRRFCAAIRSSSRPRQQPEHLLLRHHGANPP